MRMQDLWSCCVISLVAAACGQEDRGVDVAEVDLGTQGELVSRNSYRSSEDQKLHEGKRLAAVFYENDDYDGIHRHLWVDHFDYNHWRSLQGEETHSFVLAPNCSWTAYNSQGELKATYEKRNHARYHDDKEDGSKYWDHGYINCSPGSEDDRVKMIIYDDNNWSGEWFPMFKGDDIGDLMGIWDGEDVKSILLNDTRSNAKSAVAVDRYGNGIKAYRFDEGSLDTVINRQIQAFVFGGSVNIQCTDRGMCYNGGDCYSDHFYTTMENCFYARDKPSWCSLDGWCVNRPRF